jgi:hypothetical protein
MGRPGCSYLSVPTSRKKRMDGSCIFLSKFRKSRVSTTYPAKRCWQLVKCKPSDLDSNPYKCIVSKVTSRCRFQMLGVYRWHHYIDSALVAVEHKAVIAIQALSTMLCEYTSAKKKDRM